MLGDTINVGPDWGRFLHGDTLEWLLEPDDPSVRRQALTDLLDYPADDPAVLEAAAQTSSMPLVLYMLGRRNRKGLWDDGKDYYTPKHYSTFWTLCVLGDLGVGADSDEMRTVLNYMLSHQDEEGAFRRRQTTTRKPEVHAIPCTQARILRFLVQFGYAGHPSVQAGMQWLLNNQRDDGAWLCRASGEARHGCLRATHDYLRVAALLPTYRRLSVTRTAALWLIERLLDRHVGRFKVANLWYEFTFPVFDYHLISAADALTSLGFGLEHHQMAEAAGAIVDRQTETGVWVMTAEPARAPANFGRVGEPNKWITLDALRVLKRLHQRPTVT